MLPGEGFLPREGHGKYASCIVFKSTSSAGEGRGTTMISSSCFSHSSTHTRDVADSRTCTRKKLRQISPQSISCLQEWGKVKRWCC